MGPTRADGYAIVDRFPAPDWLTDALFEAPVPRLIE